MAMGDAQRWMFRGLMGITALALGAELIGMVRSVSDDRGERGTIVVQTVKVLEVPVEKKDVVVEQPCQKSQNDGTPIEKWTIGEDHFGPFAACANVDRAFIEQVMPGYEVVDATANHGLSKAFQVLANKRPVLLVIPKAADRLTIVAYDPEIETPWRIKVGDRLKKLRASARDVYCTYTADAHVWCQRSGMGGGWTDTLSYSLDVRPLGKNTAELFQYDYNAHLGRLDHLALDAISWTAR
jgi:hypothetical protein